MTATALTRTVMLLAAMTATACGAPDEPTSDNRDLPSASCTVAALRAMHYGTTVQVRQDLRLRGRVTSSDRDANFSRSLTIEDATGGVEIMVGLYDLHRRYPEGVEVAVALDGCAIGVQEGVLQIGLMPETYDYYPTAYFSSAVVADRHITRGSDISLLAPAVHTIDGLTSEQCGRLVRITALHYAPQSDDEVATAAGSRYFTDSSGLGISTFVRSAAQFADMTLSPTAEYSLTGILQYTASTDRFTIKPRYREDIAVVE